MRHLLMGRLGLLFAVAAALVLPGCFESPQQPCAYLCGPAGECPSDYQCLDDGYCHLHGVPSACAYPDAATHADASVSDLREPDLSMPDLATDDLSHPDLMTTDALPTCSDGIQNGNETGVDCGGGTCGTCADGVGCGALSNGARDCTSGFCSSMSHVCVASACADQVQDNAETDVDCGGGTCGKCANTKSCAGLANGVRDCTSGVCSSTSHVCVATTCSDQVQDNGETSVDCGTVCGGCGDGAPCTMGSDCASTFCSATGHLCVSTHCADQTQDNGETGVDCGGTCGATCGTGVACTGAGDCTSGFCSATGHVCVATHCSDQTTDNGETATDCGGGTCGTCADGQACASFATGARDCTSGFCTASGHLCVADHCVDQGQDSNETDVDCGGSCSGCLVSKNCLVPGDCASGFCTATSHVCVATHCTDQQTDNGETDVDCGGSCGTCVDGATCSIGADCTSTFCAATSKVCVATHCTDETSDNGETGIDCGGTCAATCGDGATCAMGTDCTSGFCSATTHVCVATHCTDQTTDNGETGVDCGGSCAATCANGQSCVMGTDCTSTFCSAMSHLCVATACQNQTTDFGETDTDCGGINSCDRCSAGKACLLGTDCLSGTCDVTFMCL